MQQKVRIKHYHFRSMAENDIEILRMGRYHRSRHTRLCEVEVVDRMSIYMYYYKIFFAYSFRPIHYTYKEQQKIMQNVLDHVST